MTSNLCRAFYSMHRRLKSEQDAADSDLAALLAQVSRKQDKVEECRMLIAVLAEMAWGHWGDEDNTPEVSEVMSCLVNDVVVTL